MSVFGNQEVGPNRALIGNQISICWFTCPGDGTAESITAHETAASFDKAKCAIYRKSDNRLIGVTEEISFDGPFEGWVTFKFKEPKPQLSAGTDYWLCAWGVYSSQLIAVVLPYTEFKGGICLPPRISYDNWPDPLTPFLEPFGEITSIYCTYTPGVPPPTRRLRVESEPISVPVTLNGAPIGNTPAEADVEAGTHEVGVPEEVTLP